MGRSASAVSCREGRWSLLKATKLTFTFRWEHEGRVPKVHTGGAAGASARHGMQRHGGDGGMQGWRRQQARRACLNGRGHRICAPIQHPKKKVRRGLSPYELKPTFQKKKKRGRWEREGCQSGRDKQGLRECFRNLKAATMIKSRGRC